MIFQAHRGVSSDFPENTMPAFEAAAKQGYEIIELDPEITKDKKFVLLHDKTLNRTGRTKNGEIIDGDIRICDISYDEAMKYDFGIWKGDNFRGVKISLLEDVLSFARSNKILLKIDNKHQKLDTGDRTILFELIKSYQDVACLTFNSAAELRDASKIFTDMHFHYDGEVTEEILNELSSILPRERLTVWSPIQNQNTSWVKVGFATKEIADKIKEHANLGLWLLSSEDELEGAKELGADVIETNGTLKPPSILLADMHTHSEHSHDSSCKIEDMLNAQLEHGTKIFAVTDHFDTDLYEKYDIFTPIKSAHSDIDSLSKKYPDMTILKGIEISEGFWHPEIAAKAINMTKYDVIIGSVHLVKHGELSYAYSLIDFGKLTDEEIGDYLESYFNDMLTMLQSHDFDILAHLTCPVRYIIGKYKRTVNLTRYEEKIDEILTRVIASGKSLEVNTSSFNLFGDFMPGCDILKKYRKLGGTLVTLGSDAHVANNASVSLKCAVRALKQIGFDKIYYYKNRIAYSIEI